MRKLRTWVTLLVLILAIPTMAWAQSLSSAKKRFIKALKSKNTAQISQSVRDIAALNSKNAVRFLLQVAFKADYISKQAQLSESAVIKIHEAAVEGLKGLTDSDAIDYVISQSTRHRRWQVRVLLIDVLKGIDNPKANEALAKSLKSRRQEVVLAAIDALKSKKSKEGIPALIDLVSKYKRSQNLIWIEARRALLKLTGQDFDNASDWRKWWDTVKNNFNPDQNISGKGQTVLRKKKKGPKLFGTEVYSKRVVFVLDTSGSMQMKDPVTGEGGSGTYRRPRRPGNQGNIPDHRMRIRRAKKELVKVVKQLDRDVRFNIIAYSTQAKKWKDKYLYPANSSNKASAIRFVEGLKASGVTKTDLAMKQAFEYKQANTIYLLSDGSPTDDTGQPVATRPIRDKINNMNKFRKVRIYTLGFRGANVPFMKGLANDNNGKYVNIK